MYFNEARLKWKPAEKNSIDFILGNKLDNDSWPIFLNESNSKQIRFGYLSFKSQAEKEL